VLHIGFGVFLCRGTLGCRRTQARPVSLGFERSRGWFHASWLCGRR
jgi:hypothetical protein